jgi:hypothetical protein
VGPDTDPGEKVALGEASQVIGGYVLYAAAVHDTRRDMSRSDQVLQPVRREGFYLVVVSCHGTFTPFTSAPVRA